MKRVVSRFSTSHVVATRNDLAVHVPREGTPHQTDQKSQNPPKAARGSTLVDHSKTPWIRKQQGLRKGVVYFWADDRHSWWWPLIGSPGCYPLWDNDVMTSRLSPKQHPCFSCFNLFKQCGVVVPNALYCDLLVSLHKCAMRNSHSLKWRKSSHELGISWYKKLKFSPSCD